MPRLCRWSRLAIPVESDEDIAMTQTATSPAKSPKPVHEANVSGNGDWHPMQALRQQVDNLFRDFNRDFMRWPSARSPFDLEPSGFRGLAGSAAPATDIVEHDDRFVIEAEVPGMDESNIEITLNNDVLILKGEKTEEKEEKDRNHYLSERQYGAFERRFQLPTGVDRERIAATFSRGLLKLVLPKLPQAQKSTKKIAIKAG
jgi:HSP20 family protein